MGAIHELRADYRHYRNDNPQYRVLFILLDIVVVLVKVALFAGFMLACWSLINRGSVPPGATLGGGETTPVTAPDLTEERVALLKQIAGQPADNEPNVSALVRTSISAGSEIVYRGSYIESEVTSSPVVGSVATEQPATTVVQVAAVSSSNDISVPVVLAEPGSYQGPNWVFAQAPADYTVQIAMTANRPFLESFAAKLPASQDSAIYPERKTADGEVQYSLSIGNFPDRSSAETFLASLDQVHRRYGAHLRPFNEIQSNLTSFSDINIQ